MMQFFSPTFFLLFYFILKSAASSFDLPREFFWYPKPLSSSLLLSWQGKISVS